MNGRNSVGRKSAHDYTVFESGLATWTPGLDSARGSITARLIVRIVTRLNIKEWVLNLDKHKGLNSWSISTHEWAVIRLARVCGSSDSHSVNVFSSSYLLSVGYEDAR